MASVFCFTLGAMLFALYSFVSAQQPARIPRIGILITSSASSSLPRVEAFRQRLRELGYALFAWLIRSGAATKEIFAK